MTVDVTALRNLCIKNNWFTGGSNEQYNKMMGLAYANAPITHIALAIWLCTPNVDRDTIESQLRRIKVNY